MYVLLINSDNTITASKRERIMQREKLVNKLWFLTAPEYNGYDMSQFTVMMEYVLPCSRRYKSEILELSEERYEEYLKYVLPFDSELTSESGQVELQLTFARADLDENGNSIQRVRKTSTTKINITPISAWSDLVPDDALLALDQRLIKIDSQIKAINDMNEVIIDTKADNLIYENNKLQLTANGNKIGRSVKINSSCNDNVADGVPVVDFGGYTDIVTPDDSTDNDDLNDNVVEF